MLRFPGWGMCLVGVGLCLVLLLLWVLCICLTRIVLKSGLLIRWCCILVNVLFTFGFSDGSLVWGYFYVFVDEVITGVFVVVWVCLADLIVGWIGGDLFLVVGVWAGMWFWRVVLAVGGYPVVLFPDLLRYVCSVVVLVIVFGVLGILIGVVGDCFGCLDL